MAEGGGSDGGAVPQFFGEYEVLKTIGKGKFAVVYRAKKKGSEDVVALKRIAVDMMNDKAREKCLKEVRLLQSLYHPNIIRYMDSFIMENDLIIVYEWAAAGDLKRQLRKAQERGVGFEERVIWKYFSQICNAMQHMHEKRIMHRDLKPANIFLTLDGTIKVGDLGLSRELSEHTVQAHSKVGTPLYMSPEVLKGDGYDFKSDIWSLGCLLYELTMLKSPFKSEGLNLYSLFQKISKGDFQPLSDNYSEELRSLTYSMISTDSTERPEINEVCEIAQNMRTLTTERSKQQRRAAAQAAAAAANTSDEGGADAAAVSVDAVDPAAAHERGGAAASRAVTPPAPAELKPQHGNDEAKSSSSRRDSAKEQKIMDDPATASTPPRNRLNKHMYSNNHYDYDTADAAEKKANLRDSRFDSKNQYGNHRNGVGVADLNGGGEHNEYRSREGRALQRMGSFQIELVDEGYVEGDQPNEDDRAEEFVPLRKRANSNASSVTRGNTDNTSLMTRGRSKDTINSNDADEEDDATVGVGMAGGNTRPSSRKFDRDAKSKPEDGMTIDGKSHTAGDQKSAAAASSAPLSSYLKRGGSDKSDWDNPANGFYSAPSDTNVNGVTVQAAANTAASSNVYRRPKSRQQNNSTGAAGAKGRGQKVDVGGERDFNPNRTNSKKFTEHFQNTSQSFALMEVLYNKLVVLGYPMEDPYVKAKDAASDFRSRGRLLPIHFACDLQVFPSVAGHQSGYQFLQFRRMMHVAMWLCTERIKGQTISIVAQIDVEQDTPVMMAKQILRTLPVSGLDLSPEVKEVSPTSLTAGYGTNVCHVLLHLADAALKASNHVNKPLVYLDQGNMEQQGDNDDDDEEEIIDESREPSHVQQREQGKSGRRHLDGGGDDEDGTINAHAAENSMMFSMSGNNFVAHSIMMGQVDPLQWMEETERVTPKLLAQKQKMMQMGMSEWNAHIDLLKKYDSAVRAADKLNGSQSKPQQHLLPTVLSDDLKHLGNGIKECLEGIQRSERLLNSNESCSLSSLHYSTIQKEFLIKEGQQSTLQQAIEKLTAELAELQEKEEELQESMRLKSDSVSGDGGNTQVVRIKDAIHTLKLQIRAMSMDISLRNHSLQQERIKQQQRNSKYRKKKSLEDSMSLLDDL